MPQVRRFCLSKCARTDMLTGNWMPTDLSKLAARKNTAKAEAQADATLLLLSAIACLVNLVILFNPTFAQAVLLLGQY